MGLLEELAVRCEAATGADRELDAQIRCALSDIEYPTTDTLHGRLMRQVRQDCAECYTGSVDAAIMLVPDYALWATGDDIEGPFARLCIPVGIGYLGGAQSAVFAATPALALTAAALRARHALALSKGSEG